MMSDDDFFTDHRARMSRTRKLMGAWFVFCLIASLGVGAVVIWAIIKLVTWLTAQSF